MKALREHTDAQGEQLVMVGPSDHAYEGDLIYTAKSSNNHATLGEEALLLLVAVALAVALWVGSAAAIEQTHDQGAATIRETILDTAMQCFAIEGAYPQTLIYLEDHYGLAVNYDDYSVIYEAFASNVPPTVVVKPK